MQTKTTTRATTRATRTIARHHAEQRRRDAAVIQFAWNLYDLGAEWSDAACIWHMHKRMELTAREWLLLPEG